MNGLRIREKWIKLILSGKKDWEIRGTNTKIRGKIALIQSGTNLILGYASISDVLGPLTDSQVRRNKARHAADPKEILDPVDGYDSIYAWVLTNVIKLKKPKKFRQKNGPVTWVKL